VRALRRVFRNMPHQASLWRGFWALVLSGLLSACAQPGPAPAHPKSEAEAGAQAAEQASRPAEPAHSTASVHPLLDDREPDQAHALPELSFKHLGMHIGGESNTAESKQPYLSAIERQSEALLRCYRWVDEPARGGSFGVDLYVGTAGGAPEVRGVRTKLGGESFQKCMTAAFLAVDFSPTKRPTVLSYSLLFALN